MPDATSSTNPHPPYLPVEMPWLNRLPAADEVRDHGRQHPVPGTPGAGRWLVGSVLHTTAIPVELFVDEADMIRSWTHVEADGTRGVLLDQLNLAGKRFLPIAASHFPVFLLAPAAPIDPTGAPVCHVCTEQALAGLKLLANTAFSPEKWDAYNSSNWPPGQSIAIALPGGDPPVCPPRLAAAEADLVAVIRERDHHAGRVGELLRDGTWRHHRARAFARLLPNLRCVGCGWTGSPFAAQLDADGRLLCPRCSLPALAGHDVPGYLLGDLFAYFAPAVEAALAGRSDGWSEVLKIAKAMVTMTSVLEPEGRGARRAALRAAVALRDAAQVEALHATYLDEASPLAAPETTTAEMARAFLEEITAIASGEATKHPPTRDRETGEWSCCALSVCLCAAAWGSSGQ